MPLLKSKSKEAFSHNVKAEMNAGKPQKQAVAIAYSMKEKHAKGGEISMDIQSKEHQLNKAAEEHERSCSDCYAKGGVVCPMSPKHPSMSEGELSADAKGLAKYAKGGMVDSDSDEDSAASSGGAIPESPLEQKRRALNAKSKAYENSRPDSLGENSSNPPVGDDQDADHLEMLDGEEAILSGLGEKRSLADEALYRKSSKSDLYSDQKYAMGGSVKGDEKEEAASKEDRMHSSALIGNEENNDPRYSAERDEDLSPMSPELPKDMRFVEAETNDFKDRDGMEDPDHNSGEVDEMEDTSLAGMAMKKRKKR